MWLDLCWQYMCPAPPPVLAPKTTPFHPFTQPPPSCACAVCQVAASINAGAVFYNSRYEPAMCDTDARVASQLAAAGLSTHPFAGLLLQEPWAVKVRLQGG